MNLLGKLGYKNDVEMRYARKDNLIRVKIQNIVNHELRDVIVGLFFRLEKADRTDLLRELSHYHNPPPHQGVFLGVVASAIVQQPHASILGTYQIEKIQNTSLSGGEIE